MSSASLTMTARRNAQPHTNNWSLATAWRWWRDGLLGWLPRNMRMKILGSGRRLVIQADAQELKFFRQQQESLEPISQLDPALLDRKTMRRLIKSERPTAIVLQLPAERALTRRVTLPMAAAANLRQALGYDMDRLTPFSANHLYYDALIIDRQPEQRRIQVELCALPRPEVDSALKNLAALGIHPDAVEVIGGRSAFNLLPIEQRPRRGVWSGRLLRVVVLISISLALSAAVLPLWQYRALVIQLQNQGNTLQRQSGQVLTLREQLDKAVTTSQFLMQKKQRQPAMIELLRELTAIVPDHTWLERLQVRGDTLQLVGQSSSASALLSIIEASPWFNSAAFASPVTNDRRTGKERFVLGARIAPEAQQSP